MAEIERNIAESFRRLKQYCEKEEFKGWDPYDGLNSKLFNLTPLKHWDLARLAWIQAFKRSPVNLRRIFMVPKSYNAKGIALLLNGYCNLYQLAERGETGFGTTEELSGTISKLSDLLLSLENKNYSGACWGYNFGWQARRLFFFPKETPTVVATSFAASALFNAFEITKNKELLAVAVSTADFVLNDLGRTLTNEGFILSYSPLKGNDTVYNASLLGAKTLSYCYKYTRNPLYREMAGKIVRAACAAQNEDGSWVYGTLPVQSWIDSFHTGYNLDAIAHYKFFCDDNQFDTALEKGMSYYLANFFLADGTPKYYNHQIYPIDIHCPGQLWVTISALKKWETSGDLAEKVMKWSLAHMQDRKGFFYYQLKKGLSSKISYMRWSNAFMFNAMSYYLLAQYGK